ncbi:Elongator complex protein 5, partial [Podarcis lilfordi]
LINNPPHNTIQIYMISNLKLNPSKVVLTFKALNGLKGPVYLKERLHSHHVKWEPPRVAGETQPDGPVEQIDGGMEPGSITPQGVILCLQETWCLDLHVPSLQGYEAFATPAIKPKSRGRPSGGLVTFVSTKLKCKARQQQWAPLPSQVRALLIISWSPQNSWRDPPPTLALRRRKWNSDLESKIKLHLHSSDLLALRDQYADDTTLMAESVEELKNLLMRVKEESAKYGLKLNIKKTKIMATGPITSWQIEGEEMEAMLWTTVKLAKIYHLPDNKCWKCKETE